MKKIIQLVLLAELAGFTLYGQNDPAESRFYGRAGLGGGIGLCYYDPCDYFYNEDYFCPDYDNLESVGFTPGRGFNVNIAGGYRLNKHLAVELGFRDFLGTNIKTTYTSDGEGGAYSDVYKTRGMMFQVVPGIVLNAGMDKFDPYARFGLIIGAVPRIFVKEEETDGSDKVNYEGVYKGGIPLGFNAALGVNYSLSEKVRLYAELNCNGLNYSPKKYEMTLYTENGEDQLGNLTTNQKEIEFVRKYDALEPIPSTSPAKELRESFPFSNFELDIGVVIPF
jgi:hypothetical protein